MRVYIGIDPGKDGAIAALYPEGRVWEVVLMPVVRSAKGRDEYDLATIRDVLNTWCGQEPFVTLEKLQPMPMKHGGTIANFNRGVCTAFAWMLEALRMPYQLVTPQTWQKAMHLGTPGADTKQRSILAAHRLFPGVSLARSERARVDHDGKAEALLLAEYGRRTVGNATPLPLLEARA